MAQCTAYHAGFAVSRKVRRQNPRNKLAENQPVFLWRPFQTFSFLILEGSTKLEQGHSLVFCTSLGTPLNPSKVVDRFKTVLKKGGLPAIRFHDLRHSAATILLSLGVHPKVVQEVLGHNQISMTMDIYSHVLPGMQKDAMAKLNAALQEPPEHKETGNDEPAEGNDERQSG